MVDRRHIKHEIKRLKRVKTWQLIILLIITGFMAATFLRLNNIGMVQRRDAVLAADEMGNDADAAARMYDLQRYVSSHMNADTGQFDLKEQYRRDLQASVELAAGTSSPNGNVNVKADEVCRPRFTVWSLAYVQCFTEELNKYPPSPDPASVVVPPSPLLYRHSFASPLWSADFAGFSTLLFGLILAAVFIRMISLGILYLMLKYLVRNF